MLHVDAAEFDRLGRAFARLPMELRAKAFARTMRRVNSMVRTRVVKRSSQRIKLPQKHIRAVYTMLNTGSDTLEHVVRSGWVPLIKLGAKQNTRGVSVRGRGTIAGGFIATMKSGHEGAFKRKTSRRTPIQELFGPNPASDIGNHPDVFAQVLAEVGNSHIAPRLLHETLRLLPK